MKNVLLFLMLATIVMGCSEKKLNPEQAKLLLSAHRGYPKMFTYKIYRIDPESVRELDAAGLESAGMVTLKKKWAYDEVAEPKVMFTAKSKPFLQGPSKGETERQSQEVKIADMDITEIVDIATSGDGKTAKVDFLVGYTNLTPFKALIRRSLETPEAQTEYFRLYEDGWRVDKSAAFNMQP